MEDDVYNGMFIPKGSVIIPNTRYVMMYATGFSSIIYVVLSVHSHGMRANSTTPRSSIQTASYPNLKAAAKFSLQTSFGAGVAGMSHFINTVRAEHLPTEYMGIQHLRRSIPR